MTELNDLYSSYLLCPLTEAMEYQDHMTRIESTRELGVDGKHGSIMSVCTYPTIPPIPTIFSSSFISLYLLSPFHSTFICPPFLSTLSSSSSSSPLSLYLSLRHSPSLTLSLYLFLSPPLSISSPPLSLSPSLSLPPTISAVTIGISRPPVNMMIHTVALLPPLSGNHRPALQVN